MPDYKSPGVYVEEIPSPIKPIAGVSTSTAAFIGRIPDDIFLVAPMRPTPTDPSTSQMVPFQVPAVTKTWVLVTKWSDFTNAFGGLVGDPPDEQPTNPDHTSEVDECHRNLALAVYGFFNNGGSQCYVARITDDSQLGDALDALAHIDGVSLVAAPGMSEMLKPMAYDVRAELVDHCANVPGRFAILDGPAAVALDALTRFPSEDPKKPGFMPAPTDLAAWYYPWIGVADPAGKLKDPNDDALVMCPPSGHLAGVYARVDSTRGVHKAPANEVIRGAIRPVQPLNHSDQDLLNPLGVNCIRTINGNTTVWGARTVGGDLNGDLKYINVRRTLLFIRESIERGTQWVVFEPNSPALWQKITRNVDAFLTGVWRSGALFGTTSQEAFYVTCDATTNPPDSIEAGKVVTEIGVAIVRPAEFVIFRVSQWAGPAAQ